MTTATFARWIASAALAAGAALPVAGQGPAQGMFDLGDLTPSQGIVIQADEKYSYLGSSFDSGDFNGDGYLDLIVGAYGGKMIGIGDPVFSHTGAGRVYLIYGPLAADIDLKDVGVTVTGCTFHGERPKFLGHDYVVCAGAAPGQENQCLEDFLESCHDLEDCEDHPDPMPPGPCFEDYQLVTGAVAYGDRAGRSVAFVGDVNGDGYEDVAIGAAEAFDPAHESGVLSPLGCDPLTSSECLRENQSGRVYLIYGRPDVATGVPALQGDLALADVGGSISGARFFTDRRHYKMGGEVRYMGDLNGDGYDDLVFGATSYDPDDLCFFAGAGGQGAVFVVYGRANAGGEPIVSGDFRIPSDIDMFKVLGAYFVGTGPFTYAAYLGRGDFNGDGWPALLLGEPRSNPPGRKHAGRVYLLYGTEPGQLPWYPFLGEHRLADVTGFPGGAWSIPGTVFDGAMAHDKLGWSVMTASDLDGDGCDEMLLGAPQDDGAVTQVEHAGKVYLVPGSASFPAAVDMTSPPAGTVVFAGRDGSSDGLGWSVNCAGDYNDDGVIDIILGAPNWAALSGFPIVIKGAAALIYGSASYPDDSYTIDQLATGTLAGVCFNGDSAPGNSGFAGFWVGPIGDINGDGGEDIMIGDIGFDGAEGTAEGRAYIVFGLTGSFSK